MKKIQVAVVGYGNTGKYAVEAICAAPDMELAGVVVRRIPNPLPVELSGVKVTTDIKELDNVEAAVLCIPTLSVLDNAKKLLAMGIHTVDSFDIHGSIVDLRNELDAVAKQSHAVAIVSAGWDPGSDSVVRALLEACAPKGITYTNFGPGMSMGHTVAAKAIDGVRDALSITIPLGTSIHRRVVYVALDPNADFQTVAGLIKADPYFSHDETHVIQTDDIESLIDRGHGVHLIRKGVSGAAQNQLFEYSMKINNPAVTTQVMVSAVRACFKQKAGAYTLIEVPLIDMLHGDRDSIIKKLY